MFASLIPPADQSILTFICLELMAPAWLDWKPVVTTLLCWYNWTSLPHTVQVVMVGFHLNKGTKQYLCSWLEWYPKLCTFSTFSVQLLPGKPKCTPLHTSLSYSWGSTAQLPKHLIQISSSIRENINLLSIWDPKWRSRKVFCCIVGRLCSNPSGSTAIHGQESKRANLAMLSGWEGERYSLSSQVTSELWTCANSCLWKRN